MNILYSPQAAKFISKLTKFNPEFAEKITAKIESLANNPNPSDARKVAAAKGEFMRIRAGNYRIIYFIKENCLYIKLIGARKNIYEEFNRLK